MEAFERQGTNAALATSSGRGVINTKPKVQGTQFAQSAFLILWAVKVVPSASTTRKTFRFPLVADKSAASALHPAL
jgi:hypothetical protein